MKILEVKRLAIPEILVIKFARFLDNRGYFTEQFRKSDLFNCPDLKDMGKQEFVQGNQSFSKSAVIRGLHFQWNPYMGKLVRTLSGHMIDLILDIRKGSPTFGKIIAYDLPAIKNRDYDEWIWIPPGFAHGNFFIEDTTIEYLCSGEYSPECESGICPLSKDINWSLCDKDLKNLFDKLVPTAIISDKDKNSLSLSEWDMDERSKNFLYEDLNSLSDKNKILFTGGSGLLGTEMKIILPDALYPKREEFDIMKIDQMEHYLKDKDIKLIIHAAAFTSPPLIDKDPIKALNENIIGTSNIVKICAKHNIKIVYLSTDYIFKGDKGNYSEDDPVFPVNKYAWSKLGGECAVRMYDPHLIIRTSFGPKVFPYDAAFIDQWTSREHVGIIANKIKKLIEKDIRGTIHIGSDRKTVMEYAQDLDPLKDIKKISVSQVNFKVPKDTSLNSEKFKQIMVKK